VSDLLPRWRTTAAEVCAAPDDHVTAVGTDLLQRWSGPARSYHDTAHLTEVLDGIDMLADDAAGTEVAAVRLAAWFHDAIYDGVPGEDERASAEFARDQLTELGVDPGLVAEVARLVLLTDGHDPGPDDFAGQLLCDADLAVLGRDDAGYRAYVAAASAEYAHVPAERFRTGRVRVLRELLAHRPLFHLPTANARWEAQARANISAEIARLTDSS